MTIETVGSFLTDEVLQKEEQNMAIRDIIERQIACGLTYITSGEVRRHHWAKDFWFGLSGISCHKIDSGRVYQPIESSSELLRITGKIEHNAKHPFYDDFKYLYKTVSGQGICRQTLPSPSTLLLELYDISEGRPDTIYTSIEDLISDIALAYHDTILSFYRLGCKSVQYDDIALGLMCDDNYTKRLLQGGVDLLCLHAQLIKVINDSLQDLPGDLELSIYISGGDKIVPEWEYIPYPDNIMPKALSDLNVDKFFLPFEPKNDYSFEVLRHIPKGKKVVLGLLDAHTPFQDDLDIVREAVKKAERYIHPAYLAVSPKTGFRLTSYQSRGLTYEDQWLKIKKLIWSLSPRTPLISTWRKPYGES